MIRMHYDPEADAFAVSFAPAGAYVESEEVAPGVILDFDAEGRVIGIEVLDVRERMMATEPTVTAPDAAGKAAALLSAEPKGGGSPASGGAAPARARG